MENAQTELGPVGVGIMSDEPGTRREATVRGPDGASWSSLTLTSGRQVGMRCKALSKTPEGGVPSAWGIDPADLKVETKEGTGPASKDERREVEDAILVTLAQDFPVDGDQVGASEKEAKIEKIEVNERSINKMLENIQMKQGENDQLWKEVAAMEDAEAT